MARVGSMASLLGVWKSEALSNYPDSAAAAATLAKVAAQVLPICRRHAWKVLELREFFPAQANLLGMNAGAGQTVYLRLRRPGDATFLPWHTVIGTMLHELAHNDFGPHDASFFALLDKLNVEYDADEAAGFPGSGGAAGADFSSAGAGVALGGQRLPGAPGRGGEPSQETKRKAAAAAAERRIANSRLMGAPGGQRLGGEKRVGDAAAAALPTDREGKRRLMASAAERRLAADKECANGWRAGGQGGGAGDASEIGKAHV